MTEYFVYMLRCRDGSLYTGITTDVARRLREHLAAGPTGARYTRTHPPVALAALWQTEGRACASRLEYRIKHLPSDHKRGLVTDPARVAHLSGLAEDDRFEPMAADERERLWREATLPA